ncbi:unnamed protein product [Candidula unifasciata]|uniref:Uncharacterized protein n=1 Tax=Candidula unifasciata TaxID=100452 RepID=A0A8S4A3H6_9EUPU|nr:unnamed protein product [Candidula unifasciata]
MDLMDCKVFLYPLFLKLMFKDKRRSYTVVFKYVGDYKFVIRTLKNQIKQKIIEREEYLRLTINHLHRQNALFVAHEKGVSCDEISKIILEETNKKREPRVRVHQSVYNLCCLARKRARLKLLPCFWC